MYPRRASSPPWPGTERRLSFMAPLGDEPSTPSMSVTRAPAGGRGAWCTHETLLGGQWRRLEQACSWWLASSRLRRLAAADATLGQSFGRVVWPTSLPSRPPTNNRLIDAFASGLSCPLRLIDRRRLASANVYQAKINTTRCTQTPNSSTIMPHLTPRADRPDPSTSGYGHQFRRMPCRVLHPAPSS